MNDQDDKKITDQLMSACERVKLNEPMAKHTTIGVGGPARFFAIPADADEMIRLIRAAIRLRLDYIGVGRGSNLLVRNGGFNGLVVNVGANLGKLEVRKRTAYAEAGVSFTRLGRVLMKEGRPGLEFAIGIPGSVGGAVRMNAGAYGSEIFRVLKSIKVIDGKGRIVVMKPEHLPFRYRSSGLPRTSIVLSAIIHCPPGETDDRQYEKTLDRLESQPLSNRSFGSTFKNPPGDFAGRLIEKAGLKGVLRGGMMMSDKHANFLVNVGDNTRANEAEDLIEHVIETVHSRFGVRLEPEVIIIGDR
ncbi:MAG: UDP-N-acetylmuramate dehydrogenase [bacterium]|nr:UDP-N-acetylmuramate dehydrogenase [bacterium]